MIKYGIENNYERYNFYGISGNFDPHDSQYGIYNFKRGFNGRVVELIGEFDLPTSSLYYLYDLLRKVKRAIK
jgi:lipid II:glycine glycyltransferase (peptidoglycan interpeptide bridge formation enzyme)